MFSTSVITLINLTLLTAFSIALIIYLLDKYWLHQYHNKQYEPDWWVGASYAALPILAAVLVLRSYIVEPFMIPSQSMYPNLTKGDVVLVSKSSYGIKFPLTNYTLFRTFAPKRGEVAVFQYPLDVNTFYIKRIVGLPGDVVTWRKGEMFINDEKIAVSKIDGVRSGDPVVNAQYSSEQMGDYNHTIRNIPESTPFSRELSAGFVRYRTERYLTSKGLPIDDTQYKDFRIVVIPEGYYFMMGDNRDESADSRDWGLVSKKYLVGRAFAVPLHINPEVPIWQVINKVSLGGESTLAK